MRRAGLFVGVDNYTNGIAPLNCCCKDASELNNYFARHFDNVKFLWNETARCEDILKAVKGMTDTLAPGDLLVFYFAGHGREFNGEHFLVGPAGMADSAFYRQGTVTVPELLAASDKTGVNRLFILDCCRTDLIAGRGESYCCPAARDLSLGAVLQHSTGQQGLPPLILNSCSTGQQALELQNQGHGVFTQALLNVLQSEDQPVRRFDTLLERLNQEIQKLLPQGQSQDISFTGNPVQWNHLPLFENWDKEPVANPVPDPVNGSSSKPVAKPIGSVRPADTEKPLSQDEKLTYYALLGQLEAYFKAGNDSSENSAECEALGREFKELEAQKLNSDTSARIQKLADAVTKYQKFVQNRREWLQLKQRFAELEKKVSPTAEIAALKNSALRAEKGDDLESVIYFYRQALKKIDAALVEADRQTEATRKAEEKQKQWEIEEKRKAEVWKKALAQGLVFSDDKKVLMRCTDKQIKSVVVPDGVMMIGDLAFGECTSLTKIVLPEGVTTIGDWAFSRCYSLSELILPARVTEIGFRAFSGCTSLTEIAVPEGVTMIGERAFGECSSLTCIKIPERFKRRGGDIFKLCQLEVC